MVRTTDIYYNGTTKGSHPVKYFNVVACDSDFYNIIDHIYIEDFRNGIAKVKPFHETTIDEFAEIVAGFLTRDSNFVSVAKKVFKRKLNEPFIGIKVVFNGVSALIKKEIATPDEIVERWEERVEEEKQKKEKESSQDNSLKNWSKKRLR